MPQKQKLIVTIRDGGLLHKVNALPKNVRGKVVEKALASFFDTPEGLGLMDLFKPPKAAKAPAKGAGGATGVMGDFGQ